MLLEIQGDDKEGYFLVMAPEGFFVADYCYAIEEEALTGAEELFGVSADGWSVPDGYEHNKERQQKSRQKK